jgi:sec-independent protein translocase protein TatA
MAPSTLLIGQLLIGMPSGIEWLVILIIALLFFGHKIPGMARSLGAGVNEFKAGLREGVDKDPASGTDAAGKTDKADPKAP